MPQKQIAVSGHAGIGAGGHEIPSPGIHQQVDGSVKSGLGIVPHHRGDVGLGVEQELLDVVPALRGHTGLKPLIGHRDCAGDPPQLFRVGFPQVFLKLHISGEAQCPGKPDHAGFADVQLLCQLCGGHEAGVCLMIQNKVTDAPAGFCKSRGFQRVLQLIHLASPFQFL